ncbi:MAG: hypothetical protein ACKESB_03430 [Candidatus Hodgkinia cicadicola]
MGAGRRGVREGRRGGGGREEKGRREKREKGEGEEHTHASPACLGKSCQPLLKQFLLYASPSASGAESSG